MKPLVLLTPLLLLRTGSAMPIARRELQDSESGSWDKLEELEEASGPELQGSGSGWSASLGDHPVQVRIAGGGSSGVLEMAFDGGSWDAVCDDGFGRAEATAACLTMGFAGGTAFDTTHGDSSFAADDIDCPSGATGLSQCTLGTPPYMDNCYDSETVGITCWVEVPGNCGGGGCQDTGFSCYGEADGDPEVCIDTVRSFLYSMPDDPDDYYYSSSTCEDAHQACVAVTAPECWEQICVAPPPPPMPVAPFPGYPLHSVGSYGGWEMFFFLCFLVVMTCLIPCCVGMHITTAAPKPPSQSSAKRTAMLHASKAGCLAVLWVVQIIWVHRAPWTLLCCLVLAEIMATIPLFKLVVSVQKSLLQGATMDTITQRQRWEQLGFFGMMAALLVIAMYEYGSGYYAWLVRLMLSVGAMAGENAEGDVFAYIVAWTGAFCLAASLYGPIWGLLGSLMKGATDAANQFALVVVFVALAYLWSPWGVFYNSYTCMMSVFAAMYMLFRLCKTSIQACKNRCKPSRTQPVASATTAAAPAAAATGASPSSALPVPHADTKLLELSTDSADYLMVAARLAETLPKARLVRVSRVVNPAVSAFVDMNRQRLLAELSATPREAYAKQEGADPRAVVGDPPRIHGSMTTAEESLQPKEEFEKYLWHGTRGIHPQIIWADRQDGFMTQKSNRGMWGAGTYFAENANYSTSYAHKSTTNTKQMFLAKVVVGTCIEMPPTNTLRHPPQRTDGSNLRYNTVCGQTGGSKVFVVYEGGRAFPEYLVEYSDTKQNPCSTAKQTGKLRP